MLQTNVIVKERLEIALQHVEKSSYSGPLRNSHESIDAEMSPFLG